MSIITDLYDGFSGILEQSNNTTMSYDAPMKETIDPSDIASDGKDFADKLFSQDERIPVKEMAYQEAYDASQAYNRIIQLYSRSRSDFYNLAVTENKIRIARYAWKAKVLDTIVGDSED